MKYQIALVSPSKEVRFIGLESEFKDAKGNVIKKSKNDLATQALKMAGDGWKVHQVRTAKKPVDVAHWEKHGYKIVSAKDEAKSAK